MAAQGVREKEGRESGAHTEAAVKDPSREKKN